VLFAHRTTIVRSSGENIASPGLVSRSWGGVSGLGREIEWSRSIVGGEVDKAEYKGRRHENARCSRSTLEASQAAQST